MARRASPLAEKLSSLADKARELHLQAGATAPSLDHLPERFRTVRQNISLMLSAGGGRSPSFVFHREPLPQKAVAGQPPPARIPPDAYYRLPDKHFLPTETQKPGEGGLLQMTYPPTLKTIEEFIRDELSKRLTLEAGATARLIGIPTVLQANPVEQGAEESTGGGGVRLLNVSHTSLLFQHLFF